MLRVALTGGIGAGKSRVSARLAGHGAIVIDADKIAREVVAPGTPGLAAIAAEFGDGVLLPDGSLDRAGLAAIVFADPGRLARLNEITHPLISARIAELAEAAPPGSIVVYDLPLLAEGGPAAAYDVVVVVDAPDETRIERLIRDRGMTRDQALARMAAQASRQQRLAIADIVIDNSGGFGELDRQTDAVWAEFLDRPAGSGTPVSRID